MVRFQGHRKLVNIGKYGVSFTLSYSFYPKVKGHTRQNWNMNFVPGCRVNQQCWEQTQSNTVKEKEMKWIETLFEVWIQLRIKLKDYLISLSPSLSQHTPKHNRIQNFHNKIFRMSRICSKCYLASSEKLINKTSSKVAQGLETVKTLNRAF